MNLVLLIIASPRINTAQIVAAQAAAEANHVPAPDRVDT